MDLTLILTTGRAGSSMIANIFAEHGDFFMGNVREADKWNAKGYFENIRVQRALKGTHGMDLLGEYPEPSEYFSNIFLDILVEQGWDGKQPVLVKTGFYFFRVFRPFAPKIVLVRRPIEDVIRSYQDCGFLKHYFSPNEIKKIMRRFDKDMHRSMGYDVYTDQVIEGNYTSLKNAIEAVGLTYDEEIVKDVVRPGYWHFKESK